MTTLPYAVDQVHWDAIEAADRWVDGLTGPDREETWIEVYAYASSHQCADH